MFGSSTAEQKTTWVPAPPIYSSENRQNFQIHTFKLFATAHHDSCLTCFLQLKQSFLSSKGAAFVGLEIQQYLLHFFSIGLHQQKEISAKNLSFCSYVFNVQIVYVSLANKIMKTSTHIQILTLRKSREYTPLPHFSNKILF